MVGDDRHFLGKAIDMIGLFFEEGQRDKQRKIAILNTRQLDLGVHQLLDPLPNAIAPRPDDHATTHPRFLGKVSLGNDLLIPFGKILRAGDG